MMIQIREITDYDVDYTKYWNEWKVVSDSTDQVRWNMQDKPDGEKWRM